MRRTHTFPHTADIMVNSFHDPSDGEVLAFEEQIGSHGGLGGAQSHAFLLSPTVLSAPAGRGEEIVGAEQVHRVLRHWLRESNGPQVPVGAEAGVEAEDPRPNVVKGAPFPVADGFVQDKSA